MGRLANDDASKSRWQTNVEPEQVRIARSESTERRIERARARGLCAVMLFPAVWAHCLVDPGWEQRERAIDGGGPRAAAARAAAVSA